MGRRWPLLWLALWIAGGFAASAQTPPGASSSAQNSELDLKAYQAELARISEAVKNQKNIPEVRQSLPAKWLVQTPEGDCEISTKEISDALAEIERDPEKNKATAAQLEARLNDLQRAAAELESGLAPPPSKEAEKRLQEILQGAEFRKSEGPSMMDIVRARINRWIFEHILALLRLLNVSRKTGNFVAWGVIFAAIVALFYALYRWLSKAEGNIEFRAEAEGMTSDARQWLQEAQGAAERGDYREAVHCAYWAAVARLEDTRLLPRDRTRTPRESLRLLGEHPREQGVLQTVTRSLELIWYGYRPASHADWMATKEQLEKMGCLQASIAPTAQS